MAQQTKLSFRQPVYLFGVLKNPLELLQQIFADQMSCIVSANSVKTLKEQRNTLAQCRHASTAQC